MQRYLGVIREAATAIEGAAGRAIRSYGGGAVEHEPALTDRILGHISERMVDFHTKGIQWSAKTLTSQPRGAQEKRFGADFAGVVRIALPEYVVAKGFLAQAKRLEPGAILPSGEVARLKGQCEEMLARTPAAFVFLYSTDGVTVIPAIAIMGASTGDLYEHHQRRLSRFFEEHFSCFIGDRAIDDATPAMLERINARMALLLTAAPVAPLVRTA
jgi:hypothetical protein